MAAWLPQPVMFDMSHYLNCTASGWTDEQCAYYSERWHNWYVADWTFALPTVAFFTCTIGIFIIGYALTQLLALSRRSGSSLWRRAVATTRYLSYRGFHVKTFEWNSAPVGVLLLGAIGAIYFFCMDLIPSPYYWPGTDALWGNSPPLGTRSGWLATACMPFLFATASKTNWITLLTGVTHEKLQVFHRWIAYAFMILALMHTFPFIIWHIRNSDMVYNFTVSNIFEYWTGVVALIFQAWLTFASWGPLRRINYEFFKASHFLAVVVFMIIFFWHCDGTLTSWHYFVATAAVYVPCWTYPWFRTLFEYGLGQKAQIFVEENGFTRITIPANNTWRPGQHCFLRFRSFGINALSSHPFTICSLPSMSPSKPSEMTFYIQHQGGFTARLWNYAMKHPGAQVPVFVDGPYGGIDNTKYFGSDRLIVAAGGSGAGWMLPFVEQFLRYHSLVAPGSSVKELQEDKQTFGALSRQQSLRGPRTLRLILATRDVATSTWFQSAINDLSSEYKALGTPSDMMVEVHLTGEAENIVEPPTKSSAVLKRSGSETTSEDPIENCEGDHSKTGTGAVPQAEVRGRPDLPLIIREEVASAKETRESVSVFVCGPLQMQDDARNAVARENLSILKNPVAGGVYLHLEHFSWA